MKQIYALLFLLVTGAPSCTLQKRTFRSGYHIEWRSRLHPAIRKPGKECSQLYEATYELADSAEINEPSIILCEAVSRSSMTRAAAISGSVAAPAKTEKHVRHMAPPDTTGVHPPAASMTAPELSCQTGNKSNHPLSLVSFGASLAHTVFLLLILHQLLSPSFLLVCLLLFVITVVTAVIGIRRSRHNAQYESSLAVLSLVIVIGSTAAILVICLLSMLGLAFSTAMEGFVSMLFGV